MVLVDLELPALGRLYQFKLNETVPIDQLKEEIVEMICQKEQSRFIGEPEQLMLCSKMQETVLNPKKTLSELQIKEADKLILV